MGMPIKPEGCSGGAKVVAYTNGEAGVIVNEPDLLELLINHQAKLICQNYLSGSNPGGFPAVRELKMNTTALCLACQWADCIRHKQ